MNAPCNLGVTQELAEKYDEAGQAFNFYLLCNPSETEKREVQDRIYALSAKRSAHSMHPPAGYSGRMAVSQRVTEITNS